MDHPKYQDQLSEQVAKKELRKIKDRNNQDRSIWFGLGMFGLVGWSIAIPTLIGITVGLWIDRTFEHNYSCTLMSLFVGLVIGCSIAWYWVKRESLAAEEPDNELQSEADTQKPGNQE